MAATANKMPEKSKSFFREQCSTLAKFRQKVFLVRSLEELTDRRASGRDMSRVLGVLDLLLLGIGSIIGAGVVVLTGLAAREYAGPAIVISFAFGGLAALIASLCYAEYAADVPISGGAFNYISLTFGEFPAWVAGCDMVLEYTIGVATIAKGFSAYFASLCGIPLSKIQFDVGIVTLDPLAVAAIVIISLLLAKGNRESKGFNNTMVALHMLLIAFVLCAGFPFAERSNYAPFSPFGIQGIFTGASIVFQSFIGFDAVACVGEEAKNPKRDLPIGLVGSISFSAVVYILMSLAITGMQKYTNIDLHAPFSVAFVAIGMDWASRIVSVGAITGILTSLTGNLMAQSRIYITMGRQNLLPPWMAHINPTYGTPVNATLMTGVLASLAAFFLPIELLSQLVSMGSLVVFAMVCSGVLFRRYTLQNQTETRSPVLLRLGGVLLSAIGFSFSFTYKAHIAVPICFAVLWLAITTSFLMLPVKYIPEGFRAPWTPYLPSMGVFICLHLISSLGWIAYVRWIVWFVLGTIFYLLYGVHRSWDAGEWKEELEKEQSMDGSIKTPQLVSVDMGQVSWAKPTSLVSRRSEIISREEALQLQMRNSL